MLGGRQLVCSEVGSWPGDRRFAWRSAVCCDQRRFRALLPALFRRSAVGPEVGGLLRGRRSVVTSVVLGVVTSVVPEVGLLRGRLRGRWSARRSARRSAVGSEVGGLLGSLGQTYRRGTIRPSCLQYHNNILCCCLV